MFSYLYEWIRNLSFYMILVTAFLQLLPEKSYRKYVRFFTGLVLISLLLAPVLEFLGAEHKFSDIYHEEEYEEMRKEIEKSEEYFKGIEGLEESPKFPEETPKDEENRIKIGEIQIGNKKE